MIGLLLAAQLSIVVHAPDTAVSCAPVDVTVAARAPGAIPPQISPPSGGEAFQVLRSRLTTRVDRGGNGDLTALTEGTFTIAIAREGRVSLPAFVATLGSVRTTSSTPSVDVRAGGPPAPSVVVRAWLDREGRGVPADSVFVGEQIDYVVDVHLNEAARNRLRRNPTFFPPEMPGVLAYDLAAPSALTRVGRRCYETLSYRRALFPLFAGRSAIAPAALTYSLPVSTSFFSREESFELRTDSLRFVVLDVPRDGRPLAFTGAVGAIQATSRLSVASARMGDPVVLTLRLEGAGNVKLWPRPTFKLDWATIADGGERVVVDTSQARVRGSKEFDWLLTPRAAGRRDVRALEYQFFDAARRSYQTATSDALSLDISTATLATLDSAPVTRPGVRRTLGTPVPPPSPDKPWFWVLLAVAPIPAALGRARARTRRKVDRRNAMRRLKGAAARNDSQTAADVRRLYLRAVAERVPATAGLTEQLAFSRALRRAGVTAETSFNAGELLDKLDAAAFSSGGIAEAGALAAAAAIVTAIDTEAVKLAEPRLSAMLGIVLVSALISGAAFAAITPAEEYFQKGVEAYDRSEYALATTNFAKTVSREERSVAAWSNLGTANWARGDTAGALRSWQRALRLDPRDDEARSRIDAIQPAGIRTPGFIAPISVDMIAILALGLWIAAWATLAVPPARRPQHARALAGGSIALSLAFLAGALEVRDRLDPRGLAVLRSTHSLLEGPGATLASASGFAGETGRMGAREGGWVRITLDGSRAGWIPAAYLLPLDAPPTD